jgi:hypothetical protein
MILVKDFFTMMHSINHGQYEFTSAQNRILTDNDSLHTACMLDAIKEWDAEPASV